MNVPLTQEQKRAIRSRAKVIVLQAFAGTGKTTTIAAYVRQLLRSGVPAERILALSFSNAAVDRLREKLPSAIRTRTFHSFGSRFVRRNYRQLGYSKPPRKAKARDYYDALEAAVARCPPDGSRGNSAAAPRDVRVVGSVFSTADELERPVEKTVRELYPEYLRAIPHLRRIRRAFRHELRERGLITFREMVRSVRRAAVEHPQTVRKLGYRYLVVDESQDMSREQIQAVRALSRQMDRTLICGDPFQSIYGFRAVEFGAVANAFSDARQFRLTRTFRLTKPMADLAMTLMRRHGPDAPSLATFRAGRMPELAGVRTFAKQRRHVLKAIRQAIREGAAPSDIALLTRTRTQRNDFAQILLDAGINVRLGDGPDAGRHVLALACLFELFGKWSSRASATRRAKRDQIERGIRAAVGVALDLPPSGKPTVEKCRLLINSLERGPTPHEVFRIALRGYLMLARKAGAFSPQLEFYLASLGPVVSRRASVPAGARKMRLFAKTRAVNLSTIHAAKGHEWPVVIVAGLVDGSLPISYAHTQSLVEEERRALYTAITRPSRRLTLISGPAVVARQTFRKPSQFLNSLSTWVRRT